MQNPSGRPDDGDVIFIAEALAVTLGLTVGEQTLELHFSHGKLRRGDVHVGPLKPAALRELELRIQKRGRGDWTVET